MSAIKLQILSMICIILVVFFVHTPASFALKTEVDVEFEQTKIYQIKDLIAHVREGMSTAINSDLSPSKESIHLSLGTLYYLTNNFEDAYEHFLAATNMKPCSEYAYLWSGYSSAKSGASPKDTIHLLKKSIECAPSFYEPYSALSLFFEKSEDFESAYSLLEEGIERTNGDIHLYVHQSILIVEHLRDDKEKARNIERNMLAALGNSDWNNRQLHTILGLYYLDFSHEEAKARDQFMKALDQNADSLDGVSLYSFMSIAQSYRNEHDYENAIDTLNRALSMAPDNPYLKEELDITNAEQREKSETQELSVP